MKTFLLALMLLLPLSVFAGELSSDFRGQVVDSLGESVPGAVMVVEALETGRTTRHIANDKGRWHASGLRSDLTYRITCYAPGTLLPAAQFEGTVLLGQAHVRNCVVGKLVEESPKHLYSWKWRQPTYASQVVLMSSTQDTLDKKLRQQRGPGGTWSCSPLTCGVRVINPAAPWGWADGTAKDAISVSPGTTSIGSSSCGNCHLDHNGDLLSVIVERQEWNKAQPEAKTALGSSSSN